MNLFKRLDAQRINWTRRIVVTVVQTVAAIKADSRVDKALVRKPVAVLLLAWCAVSAHAATALPQTPESCIWYADAGDIYQMRTDTNMIAHSIPITNTRAMAMNGSDCGIWVLPDNTQLHKYERNATRILSVSLPSISASFNGATQLAADSDDDSVWLANGRTLSHIGANGQFIGLSTVPGTISGIVLALDRSVWALGSNQLWHYSRQGNLISTLDLANTVSFTPRHFSVDSIGRVLWLANEKDLVQINLDQADQSPRHIALPSQTLAIALNPLTGELWLLTGGDVLLSYGRDGNARHTVNLQANNLFNADKLAFDPITRTLWTATTQALGRFSADGEFVASLSSRDSSVALAAPAFMLTPALALIRPPQNALTNAPQPTIRYGYDALCNAQPCGFAPDYFGSYSLAVTLNQQAIGPFAFDANTAQASYAPASRLPEGSNILSAQAKDSFGNLSNIANGEFTIDTVPPNFVGLTPISGSVLTEAQAVLRGAVDDIDATVVLEGVGEATNADVNGTTLDFSFPVTLAPGPNAFNLSAIDKAGNVASFSLTLTFTPPPPAAPVAASITVSKPTDGAVTVSGNAGAVGAGLNVAVTNTRTQQTVNVNADGAGGFSATIGAQAGDALVVKAVDQWGGTSATIQVTVASDNAIPPDSGPIPPDPATLVTPIDPTVPTLLATSTAFLYTGPNAIQTGVVPGTIETKRVAVLRGKVSTRDDQPLPGVTITVLGHPEFGQTGSRADGMFDMAANGGGYLTINYSRAGYLPVQRTVNTPWQDYVIAPDVVMIPLDAQATTINLNAATPIQVARGGIVSDQDGSRQATLLFAQGTTATMKLANGSTQALTSITVRATEYTVGPNGPKAMPGPLPATSGYTYAVENSIDEALAAGATTVQFNQPVYQYVDNFLNFPVGGIVPAGYYDRQKAAWIPSDNGKVIKILSVSGGIATLDTDGDGQADDAARLAALNITDSERTQLAALYAAGTSLWRVPITHFTPWDYNWPYGPPPDGSPPGMPDPGNPPLDKPCIQSGSIIECQNQSLGESVPLTGTPFSLNYKSSRMPGRDSFSVPITLSGASLPSSVKRIVLNVNVAGRQFTQSFPASPNQSHNFVWDGLDVYGQRLQGAQPVSIRIGYVYDAVYYEPKDFKQSFGNFGSGGLTSRAGMEITLWQDSRTMVGTWSATAAGLGGWTLNVQHAYDANAPVLYLGDGRTRSAQRLNGKITTVAGNGTAGFSGNGGPATAAALQSAFGVAFDAKGNLYIADSLNSRIRKVTADGIITTVAGNGLFGFSGDGGQATVAKFYTPRRVAVDAEGNLYIADTYNHCIRKVTADGIITTVAGNGTQGFSGDGGPSAAARLSQPHGAAVDAQGNLYIADSGNRRIRKVTPDGIITTVAGNGNQVFSGDGGPATAAAFFPMDVAVDAQGNMYIADAGNNRIRKVTADGIITTVAGNGLAGFAGDGGAGTAARLHYPFGLAVDAQGNLYIADNENHRIRKVTADGIITTVAGNGNQGFSGDGGAGSAARLYYPYGVAVDAQGDLYIADSSNNRVRKVSPYLVAGDGKDFIIASENGTQLYLFDPAGRHLRTLNALTGAVQYSFAYDANGYVIQITDGDNNLTSIERDANGQPAAIVAPDGNRTTLTLGAKGYLAAIANPANEVTQMAYSDGGLLTAFTNPRNQTATITYDAAGRLIKDQNAGGGFWNLARNDLDNSAYQVSMTSAEARTTTYKTEKLAIGDTRLTNTRPDGSVTVTLQKTDGSTQTVAADGTVTTAVDGPDPRFGMEAPFTSSAIIKMPSGLTSTVTSIRQAALSNPSDLLSLVTQTDTVTVNGKVFKSVYDAALRQVTSTTPLNRQTIVKTDAQSRPLTVQATGILPINYSYDPRGRLASMHQGSGADTRTVSYAYNTEGYVASVTDALNRITSYGYDAAGRVKTVTLPDTRVIGFVHDANGNVTSVTPPSRPAHGFAYNAVDLATDYTPPALGNQPVATQYAYNLDKELVKITRPDGQTVDYAYDAGGRLATLTAPNGAISYGYTANSGQLASVTTPAGIGLAYSYDGALLTKTTVAGPVAGVVNSTYDNFFRTSQLGVNGDNVAFGYDADGLLTAAGSLTLARDPANGLVIGSTLGQITTSQSYNSFGELAGFTAKQGATVLYDEQYTRDKAGRLFQKTVTIGGQSSLYGYGYDAAGRLTDVTRDGTAIGHFEYDGNGNRTLAYGINAGYDDQDRLTNFGGGQYSYSANGELQQIAAGANTTKYAYDVFGNLTHADLPGGGTLDYLVDGRNRRIGKKVNGTLIQGFLYQDQLKPAAELDGQGNVVSRFVYAGKPNVPEYLVKGGNTYRIVTDQLGSVRLVVDSATGAVMQRIDYDEWGGILSDSNPGFQPFGYAGGLYDQHTGLTRFGARDYSAQIGRWTAKDPIGFAGEDTNLLAYVENDPVNYTDPDGLQRRGGPPTVIPRYTPLTPQQTQRHHSDPVFMGGNRNQPLTPLPRQQHEQLHRDLNNFLREQTNESGQHMRPQSNNSGQTIRESHTREQLINALREFYRQYGREYPEAARDFYKQHPKAGC